MIKQIYVCECDICGTVEKAKAVNAYRNDTEYQMPNDWTHGKNSEICICPACSIKLSASVTSSVTARDPVPVYGCPSTTYTSLTAEPSITLNLAKGSAVLDSEN